MIVHVVYVLAVSNRRSQLNGLNVSTQTNRLTRIAVGSILQLILKIKMWSAQHAKQ